VGQAQQRIGQRQVFALALQRRQRSVQVGLGGGVTAPSLDRKSVV
jgi:hypothetical protein